MYFFWIIVGIFVALQLAVRLAPTSPERWHADPFLAETAERGGVLRRTVVPLAPEEALIRLSAVAETEPRTRRIAGDVAEGRITYRSRSLFWGFPDFTTMAARPHDGGAEIAVFGRQRFGQSDFGVNAKRVDGWLSEAGF